MDIWQGKWFKYQWQEAESINMPSGFFYTWRYITWTRSLQMLMNIQTYLNRIMLNQLNKGTYKSKRFFFFFFLRMGKTHLYWKLGLATWCSGFARNICITGFINNYDIYHLISKKQQNYPVSTQSFSRILSLAPYFKLLDLHIFLTSFIKNAGYIQFL